MKKNSFCAQIMIHLMISNMSLKNWGEEPTNKNEKGKDEIPANEIRLVLINLIRAMKKLRISMSKHLTILLLFFIFLPNLLTPLLKDTTSDVITEEIYFSTENVHIHENIKAEDNTEKVISEILKEVIDNMPESGRKSLKSKLDEKKGDILPSHSAGSFIRLSSFANQTSCSNRSPR